MWLWRELFVLAASLPLGISSALSINEAYDARSPADCWAM